MAGPPTGSPSPGLVTLPTPSPRSSSSPCCSSHETRAVRWAPSVTSGSSPASLMTTALAAAAAQVPVVQPVLSFWPLTFSMLGGMEGSRSLRGGICSLLGRLRPAEHVRERGAVEMRARPLGTEPWADQYERLPGEAGLPHPVGEVFEAALDDFFVGPARPVDNGARGLGGITAFQKILLQDAWLCGGEEDRHSRPVLREAPYVLAVWHRGAARTASQDHGL